MAKSLARYGRDSKFGYSIPEAGFCISAFALVRRPGKKDVLLINPHKHKFWMMDWSSHEAYKKRFPDTYEEIYSKWIFPSVYLYEGEHPDDAVKRILKDQLKVRKFKVKSPGKLLVFSEPSSWYPGKMHRDYCFVYDIELNQNVPEKLPWITESKFSNPKKDGIRHADFGTAQGDLAKKLGLI